MKSIVREMNGEKVDIVRWFEDPIEQLVEAYLRFLRMSLSIVINVGCILK